MSQPLIMVSTMLMAMTHMKAQPVIGIWHDESVQRKLGHIASRHLLSLLKGHGFSVQLLSSEDLANPQVLTPQRIAIVILPYGAHFPADAVENFRRYLKAGGRFISLGGYAFDEIWETKQGTWDKWRWEKAAHEKVQVSVAQECIRVVVPEDAPIGWHCVRSFHILRSGWYYLLTGKVRTDGIADGHGAYIAVDCFDASGKRISFRQTQVIKRTDGWQELGIVLLIPKETVKVSINAIVHGRGAAEFTDIAIKPVVNTHWGDARDAVHVDPEMFAIFDPSFRIDGATSLERTGSEGDVVVKTKEPMKGYAAVALIGSNHPVFPEAWARLVPVLVARDKYGRYLGPALSVLHHFAGPYAGSTWAFCGIETQDGRIADRPQNSPLLQSVNFQTVLIQIIRYMLDGVYLHSLQPSLWTYYRDEIATFGVKVRNDGIAPQTVVVRMEVIPMEQPLQMGKPIVLGERTVTISPREQIAVTMDWRIPQNAVSLYAVRAALGDVRTADKPPKANQKRADDGRHLQHCLNEIWSGFCVWDEDLLRNTTPIAWHDNALCEWDAERGMWRPRFWLGTNQTGVMFAPEATWENPLQWEFEFALMRRMGLRLLRVLHISNFAGDFENPHEDFWRRYDALVLMAHRHGLALMPSLHDWIGVSVSDEMMRKECAFVRLVGERYRNAPRIVWDIENEAWVEFRDHPDLHRLFNEWLRKRYGSGEDLQEAWQEDVELGDVRYAEHKPRGWGDLKFRDIQHFRRWLIERWVKANVQALREGGARQPVTDEVDWKVCGDHYEATEWLDFVNLHYYGDRSPSAIATYLKFHDRWVRGQGLAIGEFGARDHPSFRFGGWNYATTDEVVRHFVNMPLLTFALGGTMALNWDWKDMEACIFPWGLVHQHGIYARIGTRVAERGTQIWHVEAALKGAGKTIAALTKFLEQHKPSHEPQWVALVVPDEHLLGPEGEVQWSGLGPAGRISAAVFNAVEALMRLKIPFHIVREWEWTEWMNEIPGKPNRSQVDLALPDIAVFPVPFVWSDETYGAVRRFVEQGGIAVITGDFSFDANRRRTKTERLYELVGLKFIDGISSPFELDRASPIRCVATDDKFEIQEWWGKPCVRMEQGAGGKEVGWTIGATKDGEPVVVARKVGEGLVLFCADAPEFRNMDETLKVYKALLKRAAELGLRHKQADWVLNGWMGFGEEANILVFGRAGNDRGCTFVAANPGTEAQDVHLLAGRKKSRLTLTPNWVAFLATGALAETKIALFANDLWGVGPNYRECLLGRADGPTMVWSEAPSPGIGYLPMCFVPLQAGDVKLFCDEPTAMLTVRDLVTGKVLLRRKVRAKDGWLRFAVPPDLVLTEWRIERSVV